MCQTYIRSNSINLYIKHSKQIPTKTHVLARVSECSMNEKDPACIIHEVKLDQGVV